MHVVLARVKSNIISGSYRQTSEEAEENDDAGEPLPPVTYQQARSAFIEFQTFLLQSHHSTESEPPYRLLGELETHGWQQCPEATFY